MHEPVTPLRPDERGLWSSLPADSLEQVRSRVRLLTALTRESRCPMQALKALIERSNRKALKGVDVQVTVTDSTSGRQSWRGEFMSRTADGFLPSERIWLTLDNGQRGMANVSETHFNSRTPEATLIQFLGKGPLA